MDHVPFIGRVEELRALKQLQKKKTASLVIVQGRRRIGKSRLIEEFAKGQLFYSFAGLPPGKGIDAQMQRNEFSRQLGEQLGLPGLIAKDWGDLFTLLAKQTAKGKVIILFDEISWMGSEDRSFLGKLKNAWDLQFSKNPKLVLVLCGSVSSWIQKNIISNTAFLGRPSLYMNIKELPLEDCNKFWGKYSNRISGYEKFKILSVIGGIPRYLELIRPELTADENIKYCCFLPSSPLLDEFDRIFSDIFGSRSEIYQSIITLLLKGSTDQSKIFELLNKVKTGDYSEYLRDLELAGFLYRDYTWHLGTGKISKLSKYRLKDNYVRFYLKYIRHNKQKILKNFFQGQSLSSFPGWETIMGLNFENLVLNNQGKVIKLLNISPEEIIFSGPFFQKKTKEYPGCQIDLMIQTKFNNIYICEIKFFLKKVGIRVIEDISKKIENLKIPKNFSYRPILIHVNGVTDDLKTTGFFAEIIDFNELLTNNFI
jgi:uncharacterized protein